MGCCHSHRGGTVDHSGFVVGYGGAGLYAVGGVVLLVGCACVTNEHQVIFLNVALRVPLARVVTLCLWGAAQNNTPAAESLRIVVKRSCFFHWTSMVGLASSHMVVLVIFT